MPNPTLRDLSIRNIDKTVYEYIDFDLSDARGFCIPVPTQQTVVFDLDGTQIQCFGGGIILLSKTTSKLAPLFRPEIYMTCKSFLLPPGETIGTLSSLLRKQPTIQLYIEDWLISAITVAPSPHVPSMRPYVAVWALAHDSGFRFGFFGLNFRWLEYGDQYPWTT